MQPGRGWRAKVCQPDTPGRTCLWLAASRCCPAVMPSAGNSNVWENGAQEIPMGEETGTMRGSAFGICSAGQRRSADTREGSSTKQPTHFYIREILQMPSSRGMASHFHPPRGYRTEKIFSPAAERLPRSTHRGGCNRVTTSTPSSGGCRSAAMQSIRHPPPQSLHNPMFYDVMLPQPSQGRPQGAARLSSRTSLWHRFPLLPD